ncbi:hypothetical protein WJX72_000414 [[Myrmecia] bisecta]|uniref:Uncharacterized protein n=1 Tax=[Myrmecia] bisecta TaxID=41462 RepID=A0AAW1PFI5_9CHLO
MNFSDGSRVRRATSQQPSSYPTWRARSGEANARNRATIVEASVQAVMPQMVHDGPTSHSLVVAFIINFAVIGGLLSFCCLLHIVCSKRQARNPAGSGTQISDVEAPPVPQLLVPIQAGFIVAQPDGHMDIAIKAKCLSPPTLPDSKPAALEGPCTGDTCLQAGPRPGEAVPVKPEASGPLDQVEPC